MISFAIIFEIGWFLSTLLCGWILIQWHLTIERNIKFRKDILDVLDEALKRQELKTEADRLVQQDKSTS